MNIPDWVRYPRKTMQLATIASSLEARMEYLRTFAQVLHELGGPVRLDDLSSDMTALCVKILEDGSNESTALIQTAIHVLDSMGQITVLLNLNTARTPSAQEQISAYFLHKRDLDMYGTHMDEWRILQDAIRLSILESDMETSRYWLSPVRATRDHHWLSRLFDAWAYDYDDPLMYAAEDACTHIDHVMNTVSSLRRDDRVYLRVPYKFLLAGTIGTISNFEYDLTVVSWDISSRPFIIAPVLLEKI